MRELVGTSERSAHICPGMDASEEAVWRAAAASLPVAMQQPVVQGTAYCEGDT